MLCCWGRKCVGEGSVLLLFSSLHTAECTYGCCSVCGPAYCSSSTSLTVGILFLSWHSSVAFPRTSLSLLMHVCRLYSISAWSEEPYLSWWGHCIRKGLYLIIVQTLDKMEGKAQDSKVCAQVGWEGLQFLAYHADQMFLVISWMLLQVLGEFVLCPRIQGLQGSSPFSAD